MTARHFSTIGIDDVFLEPPEPSQLLPISYLINGEQSKLTEPFSSWEIIGNIKTSPEDFIVREISKRDRDIPGDLNEEERKAFQIADLVECRPLSKTESTPEPKLPSETSANDKGDERPHESSVATGLAPQQSSPKEGAETKKQEELHPLQRIETILLEAVENHDSSKVKAILESLTSLQEDALEVIKNWKDSQASGADVTTLQQKSLEIPQVPAEFSKKEFHRAMRIAFPLLQCKSVAENDRLILVSMDDFFHELIPYLYKPDEDLPGLYLFAKKGCEAQQSKEPDARHQQRGTKRKRGPDRSAPTTGEDSNNPILRLIPDLPKDQRRPIHQIIAKKNREFQTSTLPTHPLEEGASGLNTTAIVVQWSPKARKKARDQKNVVAPGKSNPYPNTLFVMKKREREHLTAINLLCGAVKCRTNDVGLAGIKDMKAVTYQYCTLRNTGPMRIFKSISFLKSKGIEVGTIRRVNFFLQNGDLHGNRFEIVVRDIQRVSVNPNSSGVASEQFVPCERKHVEQLFDRVERSGFVNFFGEQRVGAPGGTSEVGVRSFDVGRAMLQQDFGKAVDLIMTGRSMGHRSGVRENVHETLIRQTWKESHGDPDATLKVFPKGVNILARELSLLKGLKRYGKEKPLSAIQCIPNNVRRFWINAYQSYVWNTVASARLKQFGTSPVLGDLFMEEGSERVQDVKVVEADNLSLVQMEQVVLPLPGHRIQYPSNSIGDLYRKLLEEDNVCFDKKATEEGTAKGAYRHIIVKPTNMKLDVEPDACSDNDSVTSMKLSFDLTSGSYATMLLRELMLTTVARD